MVETKCIEVDTTKSSNIDANKLNNEQWQAPKALHRTFLYEHYETVPTFEDIWIECLGILDRYRMAVEDDDIRDRKVWTGVSRHWYSNVSDKSPTTSLHYGHLAIFARPNALQKLYYYTKSLCVSIPFWSTRETVMKPIDPSLDRDISRLSPTDATFGRVYGIPFSGEENGHSFPSGRLLSDSLSSFLAISKRLFGTFDILSSKVMRLGLMLLWTQPAYGSGNGGEKSDVSQDIPGWIFPIAFFLITFGFEAAGRWYQERRKWYLVEMAVSNICFPLLATDDRVPGWVTGSLLIVNMYLACSYALMDYEEMFPGPGFYLITTFTGFAICALIGSTTGLNSGSGGNSFWIYLSVDMTISIVTYGQMLGAYYRWLRRERQRIRDYDHD